MYGDIFSGGYNRGYDPFTGQPVQPYPQPQSYGPQMQAVRVNGRQGAEAFRMGTNSSALLLDHSEKYAWYIETDGAGYKSILQLDIIPHEEAPAPDYSTLDERVRKIEEVIANVQKWSDYGKNAAADSETAAFEPEIIIKQPGA